MGQQRMPRAKKKFSHMTEGRDWWRVLVNAVMNLLVP
jgi:hypothetical protein